MPTTYSFWSEPGLEPKRKFRYLLYFAGMPQFIAKSVSKPSFQVGSTQHSYLQHNFNFPGRVTWQDVSITIVDPIQPDSTSTLYKIIQDAGYVLPPNVTNDELGGARTITKADMVAALGPTVRIDTIGSGGSSEVLESWILNNPQITSVNFDTLDYSSDELLNIQIGIKYDWASLNESITTDPSLWPNGNQN
tara:strand:+ start:4134 stop:4709 length:576 start_codon:yes stop_codon:yes gene_type:complete